MFLAAPTLPGSGQGFYGFNLNPAVGVRAPSAGVADCSTSCARSGVLAASRRIELATLEVFDEGVAEDAVPSIEIGQRFRSLPQLGEEAGDAEKGAAGALMLAAGAGHGDRGLTGMLGLPANRLEQQRPAG